MGRRESDLLRGPEALFLPCSGIWKVKDDPGRPLLIQGLYSALGSVGGIREALIPACPSLPLPKASNLPVRFWLKENQEPRGPRQPLGVRRTGALRALPSLVLMLRRAVQQATFLKPKLRKSV